MEFGIGILGKGWTSEIALEQALADDLPPGRNFAAHVNKYAAKLAADSILGEPACVPDLSDRGIVTAMALCARPVRFSEAWMVRDEFLRCYAPDGV